MQEERDAIRCNWCGQSTRVIWIHGHGQCAVCGTNIDECCRGENSFRGVISNPDNAGRYKS